MSERMSAKSTENSNPTTDTPEKKIAAFFDLDRTIIAKAAMSAFKSPLHSHGLLSKRSVLSIVIGELIYLHLGATRARIEKFGRSGARLVKGKNKSEICQIIEEAVHQVVDPIIYSEALKLIEFHKSQNHLIVLVSASPEEIVQPLAKLLNADLVIASKADTDQTGRYTGNIEFLAVGTKKADAIVQLAQNMNIDLAQSYAFTDSITDIPMLEIVGHPTAINPDRALEKLAEIRGWDIDEFVEPINLSVRIKNVKKTVTDRYSEPTAILSLLPTIAILAICAFIYVLSRSKAQERKYLHQSPSDIVIF